MKTKQKTEQENRTAQTPEDYIFALDIGTRSVIGIVGVPDGEKLRIVAVESEEHKKRAMIDGQIEDIEQVSRVAGHVKERLEKRLGYQLKHVCVAAAGRALRTEKATFEMELDDNQPIQQDLICRLEAGAIEVAERQFEPQVGADHVFYLVGYSVMEYRLDDYPISTLLDHRGKCIAVDVIATFLPREVVDSLYTTMHKIGLDVASLTLEPIAAMNAAIPEKLRLLNLALVDIGAGTSDIAISKDGSVVAYTMATVAGDEITEAIMKHYLVEFNHAEEIKHRISSSESFTYTDILGFEQTVSADELRQTLEPDIRSLCQEISEDIEKVNGGKPSAVFLVGGGSKLPGMCGYVAEYLDLPQNRVAIGGNNFMLHVDSPDYDVSGPEFATPLGIAVSAALNLISDSFSITLNGNKAKLFRSKKLTVLDVLMMNGYGYNQLISRSGRSVLVEVNGEKRVFRGGVPEVAKILINGAEATVSSLVKAGDDITFQAAVPGKDARPFLYEAVPFTDPGTVTFLGKSYSIGTRALVNGVLSAPDTVLQHHDTVEYTQIVTLGDLLRSLEAPEDAEYWINGKSAQAGMVLSDGDVITAEPEKEEKPEEVQPAPVPSVQQEAAPMETHSLESVSPEDVPGEAAAEPEEEVPQTAVLHVVLNNEYLSLPQKEGGTPYYLVDMLNLVHMDLTKPEGRRIVIQINGADAAYLQKLQEGDVIDIHWEEP
ncbi:cell division protein FtsA [Caproiciproducens sp. LBM24188]|nr:cell division protein FtsA [Oscillospiraceae bacterium]